MKETRKMESTSRHLMISFDIYYHGYLLSSYGRLAQTPVLWGLRFPEGTALGCKTYPSGSISKIDASCLK